MGGIHDDHRKRLREQYAEDGIGSLSEERLLELLLFTPIPRKDTYATSKRLLKQFGNIRGVLEANIHDLQKVPDVGFSTALYLKAIYDVAYNYIEPHSKPPKKFHSELELKKYVTSMFEGSVVEKVVVLCLNRDNKLLYSGVLQEGDITSASFKMRRLTEIALKTNAAYVIIAHNHPRGSEMPSTEDIDATHRMSASLATNGVELREHYIVYKGGITSILRVLGCNIDDGIYW